MRRGQVTVLLAVTSGLLSVLLAVVVNVATGGTLPGPLAGVSWLAWPAVGLLTVAAIGLAAWQRRLDGSPAAPAVAHRPAELPAPRAGFAGRAEDIAARFRSELADKTMLVLLDDVRDAAQIRPLLPCGTDSLALVTSRRGRPGPGPCCRPGREQGSDRVRPVVHRRLHPLDGEDLVKEDGRQPQSEIAMRDGAAKRPLRPHAQGRRGSSGGPQSLRRKVDVLLGDLVPVTETQLPPGEVRQGCGCGDGGGHG